jgi:hypothetical protein
MSQHCIASIACLLSSIKLLGQTRQQEFQVLVRGVYGFQIYATEYWTEYLLAFVDLNGGLDRYSLLHSLLCQLTAGIDAAFEYEGDESVHDEPFQDGRLYHLKEHQSICKSVQKAISARSLEQLEQSLRSESCESRLSPPSASDHDDIEHSIAKRHQRKTLLIQGRWCVCPALTIPRLAPAHYERAGYPRGIVPRIGSLSK